MNKVTKLLKAVKLILQQPALLNKVLDDEDVNQREVVSTYNLPSGLKSIDILELVPDFNEIVTPYCSVDGGSTPLDLALLKALAGVIKDCNYMEIGTWMGESVTNVASVAKTCTTINLPNAEMQKMGLHKDYIGLHRFFSKNLPNVLHVQANSQTFDFSSLNQKFDLIFIDGDHHYQSVKNDTANAFNLLKDENSIIVWHDYGHNPSNVRWDVLRGILDGTPKEKQQFLYRVSNTLCAIYTQKKLTSFYPAPYANPNKSFSIQIKAEKTS